ncbi:MAG: membrane dipeptidase [Deltaproteobacteria bacterium]|nr:membrane dipeptidase [Deltaproteobacteria bacterium]
MIRSPLAILALASLAILGCRKEEPAKALDLVGKTPAAANKAEAAKSTDAARLHADTFVVDLTQDPVFRRLRDGWTLASPEADGSLDRLAKGGVDLVLASLPMTPGRTPAAALDEALATMDGLVAETGGKARIVSTFEDARTARAAGVMPYMLLLEGADGLEGAPERVDALSRRGLAVLGLVADRSNAFADAAVAPRDPGGLTDKGRALVTACHNAGVVVDLTHASQAAFWDAIAGASAQVMVSHTAARALRDHPRNLTDLQILGLARAGGVLGLVFNPDFLVTGENPAATLDDVVAHVMHIASLGASRALALGTDYDGIRPPRGLEDASRLPALTAALLGKGLPEATVRGLLGKNAERVLGHEPSDKAEERLRPILLDCESIIGEFEGALASACDGAVLADGPRIPPGSRLKARLVDVRRSPLKLEIFAEPGTPFQVEGQNLEGKVLFTHMVVVEKDGSGVLPLKPGRNLTRVFLAPTRPASLREVVIWGQ